MSIFKRFRISFRRIVGARTLLSVLVILGAPMASWAATTLKVAALSPDGSVWMKRLREAGKSIESATQGEVKLKFYPGGVMGDDKAVLRKIRAGQLHGAVLTSGGLVGVDPNFQLYSLPLAFASSEEAMAIRAAFDERLLDNLRGNGFTGFGVAEVGFAYVMTQAPVASVADVRQQKVWIPDNDPGAARLLESFSIKGIPLSIADVLTGLQTGLVNTVAAPPVGAIALQWYTQVGHALDMPLMYVYGTLAIGNRYFDKLPAAQQKIVRENLLAAVHDVDNLARRDDANAKSAVGDQGIQWHAPSAEQLAEWRSLARVANDRFAADGYIDAQLYKDFQSAIDARRNGG
ncbi:MAG: TRAP transporter substrate-binding protein DctP [Pseudomonadales bacterium]